MEIADKRQYTYVICSCRTQDDARLC